jgi:hypothetical protein
MARSGREVLMIFEKKYLPTREDKKIFQAQERSFLIDLIDSALKECYEIAEREVIKIAKKLAEADK